MHYLIFGAGAIGCYLGGRLALNGQDVTFLARPKIASSLKENGLQILTEDHRALFSNPHVVDSAEQALKDPAPDILLLTVKTYDVATAAAQIREHSSVPIPLVCFTNGVGSEALLSENLNDHPIIPATLTTAVQRIQDGIIQIERERGVAFAGSYSLLPSIMSDFSQSGMCVHRYLSANRMKWSKLLTNMVSNATSAILGWSPQRIFQHRGLFRIEVQALKETVGVMRKLGIKPQNLPGVKLALITPGLFLPQVMLQPLLGQIVSRGRGEKLPSFHYDIGRGRSEVDYINGAVVRKGKRVGYPTPTNRFLLETMRLIVNNASEQEPFRDHPEEFLARASKAGVF